MVAEDLDRLSAAGLSDEAIVQAVTIASFFNYVTRVADATGLEFDYESPLPRLQVEKARECVERPPRDTWPRPGHASPLTLALRPATQAAMEKWRACVFSRAAPLSARDRAVLARSAAWHSCDETGVVEWRHATPATERERILDRYASKLTRAPWQMEEADLAPLRGIGLDDHGLLDVVTTVALQNVLTRLRLGLAGA